MILRSSIVWIQVLIQMSVASAHYSSQLSLSLAMCGLTPWVNSIRLTEPGSVSSHAEGTHRFE
ncbi:hypothetical protein Vau01_011600 [Virgisporangium aurantiacum]|uniref:Uncharacterized protein n=1 Tax=Virgisporangium aurantiacum TaxID=175570 RepID=A0A8J3YX83_9ACTN|nr:hypothetical protein Vau01_011600 [Virgisporangium aurantiacum]